MLNNFKRDLEIGIKGEKLVASVLASLTPGYIFSFTDRSE
jgi:hypothetical protein